MRAFDVLMNRLVNPMVVAVLRSRLHGLLSRRVAVVETRGRRTGRLRRTPVNFRRDGDVVVVRSLPHRTWWRNVAADPSARVWLGGRPVHVLADVAVHDKRVDIRLTPTARR